MASVAENLRAAKALIDSPDKWARSIDEVADLKLTADCAPSALLDWPRRPDGGHGHHYAWDQAQAMRDVLLAALPAEHQLLRSLSSFNDDPSTSHADVMALFDRAIAAAEQGA